MNDYEIKRTVYAKEDGTVTHESGNGENRVVYVMGNAVPQEEADRLNLPALDAASDAREAAEFEKATNPLTGLKPAAAPETKVEDDKAKGTKKTPASTTQEVK